MPLDLDYLNEDLKDMGPLPAAKLKKVKRTYYAAPAFPGPERIKVPVTRAKKTPSSRETADAS